ncbi:MAG: redoxin domain-containing protein [Planctomycetes bacterium]|nr:redoxin domain-containing protein [Planctomycetota bacterium]
MSHLNQLQDELGDRGLSVIGVTGETPAQTDPWIKEKGAKYAYAYDKGLALMKDLGCGGFPSAVLVDSSGTVVWKGHPGSLTKDTVEEHLAGALSKPMWEWPDATKDLRKAILKNDYSKAIELAAALDQNEAELVTIGAAVNALVAGKATSVESAFKKGDFLTAETRGKELSKALKGLPEAEKVDEVLAAIKADPEAKKVIKAQKALQKIADGRDKLNRSKKVDAAVSSIQRIIRGLEDGSFAAIQGEKMIQELEASKQNMR